MPKKGEKKGTQGKGNEKGTQGKPQGNVFLGRAQLLNLFRVTFVVVFVVVLSLHTWVLFGWRRTW